MKKLFLCLLLVMLVGCAGPEPQQQPQPSCGHDGPPWILHNINNMNDLHTFVAAAETPETAEQWIKENWNGSWDLLSGYEDLYALASELKALPIPSIAAKPESNLQVLPDYGRDYVWIDYKSAKVRCTIKIHMRAEPDQTEAFDRPLKAENFQSLFDQTKRSLRVNTNRYYKGQVDGTWVSVHLVGYNRKEALQFLRELQFEKLSNQVQNNAV